MSCWGVVVAAGAGHRFGAPKHDVLLAGRPLWQWARDALLDGGATGVVLVGPVPGGVPGGERRRDSVAAGLAELPPGVATVLVHDAARPLAGPDLVARVAARLHEGGVDGVVPVVAVRDTVKEVDAGRVLRTVDRSRLALVQTPQGFPVAALRAAHETVTGDAPDDAWLVERAGGAVATVPGDPRNLKVTYPDDLAILAALL